MIIGKFTKVGDNFEGAIDTLTISRIVHLTNETTRSNDKAPSHRVLIDDTEVGAAWAKRSNDDRPYLSVKLDDPSFVAPIQANLYENADGGYALVWNRPQRRESRD